MSNGGFASALLLLGVTACVRVVSASPIGTSVINCHSVSEEIRLGPVEEEYSGDVEVFSGITPGSDVKLVSFIFPEHLEFLELSFTLGQTSATVRTRKPLDADSLSDGILHYAVVCGDDIKYHNTRTLKLIDINDNRPVFKQSAYNTTISETHSMNSEVLQVEAVDKDSSSVNNRVTYSVEPTPEDFSFTSGIFLLKERLNYNLVREYHFVVTAQDVDGLNDTAPVVIRVEDFDNLNPYFSHSLYQAVIQENEIGPLTITHPEAIKAQDGDTGINMTVTYSIAAVSPARYGENMNIDPDSGVLSVLTAIDREELDQSMISVSIRAAQSDDALKTADAVVFVTVEDVNDNSPQFDQPDYSVTLPENSPVGTIAFAARVTDLDEGGFVGTLHVLPGSAPFSIAPDGTVKVRKSTALDREAEDTLTFQIEARDPPNPPTTARVTVTLRDENDNSPTFSSDRFEAKVYANQTVGMNVVQVHADDPDEGVNGLVTYSIDFGNDNGYFSIDGTTGLISLAKTIPLVENRILEFPLYVTARDGGVKSLSSSALVMILAPGNSDAQFLQKVYRGTIEEEQNPGVVIVKVDFLAIDLEIPVTLQVVTHPDKFSISSTGEFTTATRLDYDDGPHNYSVEITVSDGTNTDHATVEVQVTDVNDNSPVFAAGSVTRVVPEDADIGSSVAVVAATDRDSGINRDIRYSLRGGEGRFAVHPVSGTVTVGAGLDRETRPSYDLLVVAEDQGRPARTATATLLIQVSDVNDNTPKFLQDQYQVEVLETETVGGTLLTLSALDPDEGVNGIVTYRILQQSPPSEHAMFELNSSSGVLRLSRPLDYSEAEVYSLVVQASDGGTPALVSNASVEVRVKDVNNNKPEFSQDHYSKAVSENLASGASILTLEVTDRDEGGFSNGFFVHSSDTFHISKQGVVFLRNNVTLDREKIDRYVFEVVAVDQPDGGLKSTAQLNITVLDYNDNTPQFPSIPDPLQIPEGSYSEETPGEVFTIVATDADLGSNGEVTLSILSPDPLFRFREDGTLLAVGPLDRETRDNYELLVKAADNGSPQLENITSVRVSLVDVNDNRPQFMSPGYVSTILLKEAEEGQLVLTLSATDPDAGNNSRIAYSFSAGSSPHLALNSETGAVTLTSDLSDVMKDTTLRLTAMAADHGTPPLNSIVPVVVNLRLATLVDSVVFLSSSYNFSTLENREEESVVGTVRATPGSDLYEVIYAIKAHTDTFSIEANGDIVTKETLDRERQEWYFLEVEAVDTRSPPTSAVTQVRIQVENVNESPEFPDETYKASVFNSAPYRSPVIHIKASDPDFGHTENLRYSVLGDTTHFDVERTSGLLYVVSAAGLDEKVEVEVRATDPEGLYATASVEVVVEGSGSSSDLVTVTLNQPVKTVEKKRSALEKSLGEALEWTVIVVQIQGTMDRNSVSRMTEETMKTVVSFFAVDGEDFIPAAEVKRKLQEERAAVEKKLAEVFGEDTHFEVEMLPQAANSNQVTVIALGVLLALSILGLVAAVVAIIWFKRKEKQKGNFEDDASDEGYSNKALRLSETPDQEQSWPNERGAEGEPRETDRNRAEWDGERHGERMDSGATRVTDGSNEGSSSL